MQMNLALSGMVKDVVPKFSVGQPEPLILLLNIYLFYIHSPKPSQRPDFNMCAELFKLTLNYLSVWYIWIVC